jgi:rfaE bifunctional protein nucleotidyltransferase chain/domain
MKKLNQKIMTLRTFVAERKRLRRAGKKLVMTNGCFDVLHPGHVYYLTRARRMGDVLLVALNSDSSVRTLKGADRPVRKEKDRATMLAALEAVDYVISFRETTAENIIRAIGPDIYVKGGDYTPKTLNRGEVQAVMTRGGKIKIMPVLEGHSTTHFLRSLERKGRGRFILSE